jgi:hypothetical protein
VSGEVAMDFNGVLRFCGFVCVGYFSLISVSDVVASGQGEENQVSRLTSVEEVTAFGQEEVRKFFADFPDRNTQLLCKPAIVTTGFAHDPFYSDPNKLIQPKVVYLARYVSGKVKNPDGTESEEDNEIVAEVWQDSHGKWRPVSPRGYLTENSPAPQNTFDWDPNDWKPLSGKITIEQVTIFEMETRLKYGVLRSVPVLNQEGGALMSQTPVVGDDGQVLRYEEIPSKYTIPGGMSVDQFSTQMDDFCSHVRAALEEKYPANKIIDTKLGLSPPQKVEGRLQRRTTEGEVTMPSSSAISKVVAWVVGGVGVLITGGLIASFLIRKRQAVH